MSREIIQQALDALIAAEVLLPLRYKSKWVGIKAIAALEAELAKPEQAEQIEPEDWRHHRHFHEQAEKPEPRKEWLTLSDTEINKIVDLNTSDDGGFDIFCDGFDIAHIVCAKLKELNK
jgi:hypothetical protein